MSIASEEDLRTDIKLMKARLNKLVEANQKANVANYERIHELIDEQESKIVDV